jgi:4-diphosphocytidyl-2-C-methyl-D-erythritol kinase
VIVTLSAHAKVNLFLRVLSRNEDGYHGLETVFCLLSLADTLTAERIDRGGVTVEVSGAEAGPAEQNLAVKAGSSVLEVTGNRFGIRLTLTKRIPIGAGLGGGSTDAAAALHVANRLAGDVIPRHELLQIGSRLGSDVPFFFTGAPLALAWNRGDRLLRLPPLPAAPALLLTPPTRVSTPEAYAWLDTAKQSGSGRGAVALDLDALSRWGDIGRMAGNDFESPVFGRHPEIRNGFEALVATRPLVCRMTGSGSTLFAVYRSTRDREDAMLMLGRKHGVLTAVETLATIPAGPEQIASVR